MSLGIAAPLSAVNLAFAMNIKRMHSLWSTWLVVSLIHPRSRDMETDTQREQAPSCWLTPQRPCPQGLKLGADNSFQVSHVDGRSPITRAIISASQDAR